jgi:hypothetical protein
MDTYIAQQLGVLSHTHKHLTKLLLLHAARLPASRRIERQVPWLKRHNNPYSLARKPKKTTNAPKVLAKVRHAAENLLPEICSYSVSEKSAKRGGGVFFLHDR